VGVLSPSRGIGGSGRGSSTSLRKRRKGDFALDLDLVDLLDLASDPAKEGERDRKGRGRSSTRRWEGERGGWNSTLIGE
jgi:hypothetical protein